MKSLDLTGFEKQDIKTEAITSDQLAQMHALAGTYEVLFSKVARKYRALRLNERELKEADLKDYLLQEYTFLKRPVFIIDDQIFIGNSKKNVTALQELLG